MQPKDLFKTTAGGSLSPAQELCLRDTIQNFATVQMGWAWMPVPNDGPVGFSKGSLEKH